MKARNRSLRAGVCLVGAVLSLLAGNALAGSVAYTYDTLGRLKKAVFTNSSNVTTATVTYTYDAAGNRTSVTTYSAT